MALVVAASAGADSGGAQAFVFGTGTGHFQETGGPFQLSVAARGEGPFASGYARGSARGSGDYVGEF